MRELAKLRALTPAERRLLIVAFAATPLVAGGLSVFGFRRWHAAMSRWPRPRSARFSTERAASAKAVSVSRVVDIAAGRRPFRAGCLRRSLLLWWLLKRDGIETILKVGVNRENGTL